MARLPLYYFNIVSHVGRTTQITEAQLQSIWSEIDRSIDSLQPPPKKMYNDGLFTFNNKLIVIPPGSVPDALKEIYKMPEGYNKRILLKLADMGTSLIPCEEHELLTAWQKNEAEIVRKEEAGETISAEEIGRQSLYLLTRNKVIGQVIAQTLSEDEAGVLFLGCVHNLKGMMANNYLTDTLGLNVIEMNPQVR
ncbi:hypothetical protein [Desulfomonile tiedjei]|uniref:Uncharacterized protein n=1 Tax=Desulfomonile tiedjei (strain ATCC 49306 / DSM 6799 / DCB-1) TaxID=706587 RepID=I4C4U6_DESTA|nr:hypothetical protein [Desulfomonile tiedjei]AFM24587.1 hypothetical protein Desti_1879 [Desulfomonile tiedjei DSM 6799]